MLLCKVANIGTRKMRKVFQITRSYSTRHLDGRILAIRREDQSVWERRAPLAPHHVKELVKKGVKVLVQPSNRRAYPMQAYQSVGATIQEDISAADAVIGVKQVPIDQLIPHKTYAFFSHTIKAQESNMPLLDAVLEKNIRLIDYEKMVDNAGQRVVAFGKYAGVAGMINILHGLGLRLLALGHHTPFMYIGPAHNYRNKEMARQAIRGAGYEVALGMMPRSIGPMTFVFTGTGNVSQGAQDIFQNFPHEFVPVSALKKISEHGASNKFYACEVSRQDHLVRKDGGPYDALEYEEHPERYVSVFAHQIAPYASVIVNGIYYAPNSPKLITIPDAKHLLQPVSTPWISSSMGSPTLPQRMLAICDISADPGGSMEFVTECTTIDSPFCLYDADQNKDTTSFKGPGVLVCSIDNMPTQLPLESTDYFGDMLFPYVSDIVLSNAKEDFDPSRMQREVAAAVIASNGNLTPGFQYISELRNQNRSRHKASSSTMSKKNVLILGAGHVSEPMVEYLSRDGQIGLTVASALRDEVDALADKYNCCEPLLLDVVERPDLMDKAIQDADLVVSLLPYSLHPHVLKQCINRKKNMLTASYCTPQMKPLHDASVDAGITVVNEVGLDPGIDHFLALECIDEVQKNGGRIESFVSYCGGLPAPEFSDNPLRYKFSWSPRGVLLNTKAAARYLRDGKVVDIPAGGSLLSSTEPFDFLPGFALEGFPNRDSTIYQKLYGIDEAKTILRGTLRYRGFSDAAIGLINLGLISEEAHPCFHPNGPDITWRQVICNMLNLDPSTFYDNLIAEIANKTGSMERTRAIEGLGLLEDHNVFRANTPLDSLARFLSQKLKFGDNERDMIVLRHDIQVAFPNGEREKRGITLVCYGDPQGYTAMAKTVAYPAAIAAKMVLDGEIQAKGMVFPFTREIYHPLLVRLEAEGIKATEKVIKLS